jgi:hypothetical protein
VKKIAVFLLIAAALVAAAPAEAGGARIGIGISHGWGHGWGYGGWGWGYRPWGGYYPGWYWDGPRYGGYPVVYPREGLRYGALDTDISPERAEVWVDGERVGVADDFDGFPDFLWLENGTYDVVFYAPGHQTLARQYSIYGGQVIDVEDRMQPGEAVLPQDLGPKSHERRDERIRRDREQREEVERRAGERYESDEERPRAELRAEAPLDARGEPGRLRLRVQPEDASVYLDGRFLGTGRELARLRSGLIVDAGAHTLEVVRPGLEEATRSFTVESGRDVELEVALEE